MWLGHAAAAAAAKSLQLCPTLCDPIDGSPPGSPVPGILRHGAHILGQNMFLDISVKVFFFSDEINIY